LHAFGGSAVPEPAARSSCRKNLDRIFIMAQIDHTHAAKSHEDAAKAHHSAAELHTKSDGKGALDLSKKANELSQVAHQESSQAGPAQHARN
jgi:hypothetical protein